MAEGIVAILNWIMGHFGALDFVVICGALYTAWLHQGEVSDHAKTIEYTRKLQDAFIAAQLAQVKVLSDLNYLIQNLDKGKD